MHKIQESKVWHKIYQLCISNGVLLDFIVYHGYITPQLIEMEKGVLITERLPGTL